MDYIKPADVAKNMIETAAAKAALSAKDLLIRGFLSGALLGFATSLAFVGSKQTGVPLVGALIFPVGFVLIILLGLELVTGNFALLPVGVQAKRVSGSQLVSNFAWVYLGNLIGSLFYGFLLVITLKYGDGEPGHNRSATYSGGRGKDSWIRTAWVYRASGLFYQSDPLQLDGVSGNCCRDDFYVHDW